MHTKMRKINVPGLVACRVQPQNKDRILWLITVPEESALKLWKTSLQERNWWHCLMHPLKVVYSAFYMYVEFLFYLKILLYYEWMKKVFSAPEVWMLWNLKYCWLLHLGFNDVSMNLRFPSSAAPSPVPLLSKLVAVEHQARNWDKQL